MYQDRDFNESIGERTVRQTDRPTEVDNCFRFSFLNWYWYLYSWVIGFQFYTSSGAFEQRRIRGNSVEGGHKNISTSTLPKLRSKGGRIQRGVEFWDSVSGDQTPEYTMFMYLCVCVSLCLRTVPCVIEGAFKSKGIDASSTMQYREGS